MGWQNKNFLLTYAHGIKRKGDNDEGLLMPSSVVRNHEGEELDKVERSTQ